MAHHCLASVEELRSRRGARRPRAGNECRRGHCPTGGSPALSSGRTRVLHQSRARTRCSAALSAGTLGCRIVDLPCLSPGTHGTRPWARRHATASLPRAFGRGRLRRKTHLARVADIDGSSGAARAALPPALPPLGSGLRGGRTARGGCAARAAAPSHRRSVGSIDVRVCRSTGSRLVQVWRNEVSIMPAPMTRRTRTSRRRSCRRAQRRRTRPRPLTVPVWYRYEPGGEIIVVTRPEARKARLLAVGARVAFSCSPRRCRRSTSRSRDASVGRARGHRARPQTRRAQVPRRRSRRCLRRQHATERHQRDRGPHPSRALVLARFRSVSVTS